VLTAATCVVPAVLTSPVWVVPAVLIAVGAAFDFHAGTVKQAPAWIQNIGLEWLSRLLQEPKRLWKRYFMTNSLFLYLFFKASLKKLF
jgi:N-acetylglucosaminyldiphosphoundecaprenol N-acetyl-beta-D-mannosaminyltransferase